MPTTQEAIPVVESAYAVEDCLNSWLERLTKSIRKSGLAPLGAYATSFRCMSGAVTFGPWARAGLPDGWMGVLVDRVDDFLTSLRSRYYKPGAGVAVELASVAFGREWREGKMRSVMELERFGIEDILGVCICERDKSGVFVGIPCSDEGRRHNRGFDFWYQLALHVGAGYRLQRNVGTRSLLESVGSARDRQVRRAAGADRRKRLREAVQRIDTRRGQRYQKSRESTLNIWHGLVEGRWSLVDVFDSEGRRYLFARRNEPQSRDPRALTSRERQVAVAAGRGYSNKQIAYALGLKPSTIGTHLSAVMKKLGVANRQELVLLLMALVGHPVSLTTPLLSENHVPTASEFNG